jgi:hypothetical protein
MEAPTPPPVAVDPNLQAQQAAAQTTLISSLQTQARDDTAALMSRYGARLALSGVTGASTPVSG